MTRMTETCEDQRGVYEDALSRLGVARIRIDTQVKLRIQQAIRRDARLTDLLQPALDEMRHVDDAVSVAQEIIGDVWRDRNVTGW